MTDEYLTPATGCLNCGESLDAASHVSGNDRAPEEGDLALCLYCGHVQVYGAGMSLREMTDAEVVDLAGDEDLLEAMEFIKFFREQNQ